MLEFQGIYDNHILVKRGSVDAVEEVKNNKEISVYLHLKDVHIPVKNSYDEVVKILGEE